MKLNFGVNEFVICIVVCGICVSDCKCYIGVKMFWGGFSLWVKVLVIFGYEFFGYVEVFGDGVVEYFGVVLGDCVIVE